jgi:hypothetical protein
MSTSANSASRGSVANGVSTGLFLTAFVMVTRGKAYLFEVWDSSGSSVTASLCKAKKRARGPLERLHPAVLGRRAA